MKNIIEIRDYLLANRVNEKGNIDLSHLDFSDFEGDIFIYSMKVKKDLVQGRQEVRGNLYQNNQQVQGDLYQGGQEANGKFYTQKLAKNEEYKINKYGKNEIVKKTK
ncbi:MAG: hypothetical protein RR662_05325 [Clostridia bacterium]